VSRNKPHDLIFRKMPRVGATLEAGVVTAVGGGRASVSWAGTVVTQVAYLGTAPSVGAKVWMLQQGSTLLILGTA
jgi:hypothetical protein